MPDRRLTPALPRRRRPPVRRSARLTPSRTAALRIDAIVSRGRGDRSGAPQGQR